MSENQGFEPQSHAQPAYPHEGYPQQGFPPAPVGSPSAPPLPPSNAGWAVAAVLFFWPLAFSAFNHVHDVYPKWAMGDYQGAQYASDRAKQLGKIALWVWVGLMILFVVVYVIFIVAMIASIGDAAAR
ncbi:CD225/dispanin family protein [Rhodococcus sp. NPDC058521]|uniref:CD225/dispanin family protein n=1 Tax=Rhodococcus sp. NPDC058521 TaxID=3346536 RepID=UPI003655070B